MKSGYSHCSITQHWHTIVNSPNFKQRYSSGGLGKRMVSGEYHVWLCDKYDLCQGGFAGEDMMCYVFNEKLHTFLPLGPNSKVKLVKNSR